MLLLAIPIAFDGLGIALLAHSVDSLQTALKKERNETESLKLIDGLFTDFAEATGQYFGYVTGGKDKERLDHALAFITSGKNEIAQVRKLNPDKPQFNILLSRLEIEGFDALQKLATEDSAHEGGSIQAISHMRPMMLRCSAVNRMCLKLLEVKQQDRDALVLQQEKEMKILFSLITLAATMNISAAGIAIFLFRESISKRLNILIDNSKRLSRLDAPGPSLEGDDEFSQLDSVLRKVHSELKENDEFRSNVVTMVAHDLRSPLASMRIALEMAQSGHFGNMDEGVRKRVDSAYRTSNELINLTDGFLDLNKIQEGKLNLEYSRFPVTPLFDETTESLIHLAQARDIELHIDENDFEIEADRRKLAQILINLVSNAIKFSPPKSKIIISAAQTGDKAIISVSDQGPGISDDAQITLFKRFTQGETKSEVLQGSGLGLFLSRWFVEAHGGEIGVESKVGVGSRFWLSIPKKRS